MMLGGVSGEEGSRLLPRAPRSGCVKEVKSCGRWVRNNCALSISLVSLLVTIGLIATAYGVKMSQADERSNSTQPYALAAGAFMILGMMTSLYACCKMRADEANESAVFFLAPSLPHVMSAPAQLESR